MAQPLGSECTLWPGVGLGIIGPLVTKREAWSLAWGRGLMTEHRAEGLMRDVEGLMRDVAGTKLKLPALESPSVPTWGFQNV